MEYMCYNRIIFCTVPTSLQFKYDKDNQADSRRGLSDDLFLSASLYLRRTSPTDHLSPTPNDCIHIGHHIHEGPITFLQRLENLQSS